MGAIVKKISLAHLSKVLAPRGLGAEIERFGVYSVESADELPDELRGSKYAVAPGLVFSWHSPTGEIIPQFRPDEPELNDAGDPVKYVFPGGSRMVLNVLKNSAETDGPLLIAEGTMQSIAAALHAPSEYAVVGLSGCWNWRNGDTSVSISDLEIVDGHDVIVALDADAATNLSVYTAGMALRDAIVGEGATSVKFLRLPGAGAKAGLDDVLAGKAEDRRAAWLARQIEQAAAKPADVKPRTSAKAGGAVSPFFDGDKLKVKTLAEAVVTLQPVVLTREDKIAVYLGGVYRIDGKGFLSTVTDLLGENFRTSHASNVESYAIGQLAKHNRYLPDRLEEPLLNCRNGMVDLRTGELIDHDPKYPSVAQIQVTYDPGASCPTYEEWAAEQIGDQLDDLEETVALMLDPTITPTKAVFLFGAARSGKSTYLRLLQEIAGPENYSAVTLHQLSDDRFAAANLYGKMLNVAADLPASHVEDLSTFKMMTGEDPVQANRKYGNQFAFVNRALFAFSANEPPTVGESSRAYAERIKPFHFSNSFAGREDPALEARLRDELPGILARLVRAHQRRAARGRLLDTDPRVRELFEIASDRVRQFVGECCEILTVETTKGGTKNAAAATTTELYLAFKRWAEDEGRASLAKSKFRMRLGNVPGVIESISSGKSRGWNLRLLPVSERGTLSVSTHPIQTRDEHTEGSKSTEGHSSGVGRMGQNGQSSTVSSNVGSIDDLLSGAVPASPEPCPDCDQPKELVPPGLFWYACRGCHPDTFARR
jgi:putative DNA primase/helicase